VTGAAPALRLSGVGVTRDGRDLLHGVDLTVRPGDRWVVLGANGSGKTTLLRVASLALAPTRGTVDVLGARYGALEPWWHPARADDREVARGWLERLGAAHLAGRTFGTLSSGERQRVLVARSLVSDPGLLLLDEPTAGLDLGARERLVTGLGRLAADPATPPMVFVTHHVEEIPAGATSLLLLREGHVLAAGELAATLTADALSDAFGLRLEVRQQSGRWSAVALEV
jgi:iron complex transport system ATP-binding protein